MLGSGSTPQLRTTARRMKGARVKRILVCCGLVLLLVQLSSRTSRMMAQTSGPMTVESRQAFVNQYCSACHNETTKSGGFSLKDVDLKNPSSTADRAEKVILK